MLFQKQKEREKNKKQIMVAKIDVSSKNSFPQYEKFLYPSCEWGKKIFNFSLGTKRK